MVDNFGYDVFLSHSSKDKAIVRNIAERLRSDGLRVWFLDWELRPGDSIAAKIDEGLERSRVLVLCMSANAFGPDWVLLESGTFLFRDPMNKYRRLIPLRLDESPIKGSLANIHFLNWLPDDREQEYPKLLDACRPLPKPQVTEAQNVRAQLPSIAMNPDSGVATWACVFSRDGRLALAGSNDKTVRLWDVQAGQCLRVLEGHGDGFTTAAWSADQRYAFSGSDDGTVRLWDVQAGLCLFVLEGHEGGVTSVAWRFDGRFALSGSDDKTVRLWDVDEGLCLRVFQGHGDAVKSVGWSYDGRLALSGSGDKTVRLWEATTGLCLRVLEGHADGVTCVSPSADGRFVLTGSDDRTLRLWEAETGRCLRVLEGHADGVTSVASSADGRFALTGSHDRTVRLWELESGRCLRVFEGPGDDVTSVAWSADQLQVISGDSSGGIRASSLTETDADTRRAEAPARQQVQYTNAKVLLVGESGAGKTGLCQRLAFNNWQPTDSTVGTSATQWTLPMATVGDVQREVWLWDLGGQADQRLIHQLYMEDTALAVLVFDGQKDDVFETLARWDRDLTRASRQAFTKLLVAGRVDAGGLLVKRSQIESFARERGYSQFLETSAKANLGCEELKQAIVAGIRWEAIPWRTSPLLFNRLRDEIVQLRNRGRALMRFNELREVLQLRLTGEYARFTDEELKVVVRLLAGSGVVWELAFGNWLLLQPEWINSYAQAVIQTLRSDEYERGVIPEERVLSGTLVYKSSMHRLDVEDERFVLLALHHTLVERGLCLRERTDKGAMLIFPSYFQRERPDIVLYPAVLVSYRFNGFLDDIYATLVVRLHYTELFHQDQLWRYAADFKTMSGKQLGVKLNRLAEGMGELVVYFDRSIPLEEKILFSKYVHEHLLQRGQNVVRLRHYVCPHCGTPVSNLEVAMKKLEEGKRNIVCVDCEKRIPLWDELERSFASPETKQRVRELEEQSAIVLDNESRERALVGEVIATVALAGQISREFNSSDHGIDMEIEFKDEVGQATGKKVYLQLKAGDSYLHKRKLDGAEVFLIKNDRHAAYWMAQPFPVMLVIRNSDGEIRWMEIRDWLKSASDDGKKTVKQIVFEGQRFDVMSVRRWREPMIQQSRESLATQAVKNSDPDVRLSSIERLIMSWPDDVTRQLLFDDCINDSEERIRALVVKRSASLWPDDRTRDFLLGVSRRDASSEVKSVVCEALSDLWWKEINIRRWLRSRVKDEPSEGIRERLTRALENAGAQLSVFWEAKLSGERRPEKDPETLPGYPAFRVSRVRLRDIGPFQDTGEVELRRGVNVFLGDNAAGKTTLLRCLALAAVGPVAANEVEDKASMYLRKGAQRGIIEVLFELVPDPDALPAEVGYFAVGLQITLGSSRFASLPRSEMTIRRPSHATRLPDQQAGPLPNSAEFLGLLRSDSIEQFGFVSGYGAVRAFGESRFALQAELKKRENEWVLSLFKPEAPLVNPEVFTKLIRGDTSNIEESPHGGLPDSLIETLGTSLKHLFPDVDTFFREGDNDLQLNGTSLRFGELSDGYRSLFALMGHLLRCALRLCNWNDNPSQIDGIALIDEIDLHLHPTWQHHVVQDFRKTFRNIQLIASTHSPLVVGALKRDDVFIMRREEDGSIRVDHPEFDPQGLGVAGILTSIFDLNSTIDQPTLDKINRRLELHSQREKWEQKDEREYAELSDELAKLGFNRALTDPYFERFATAMAKRHRAALEKLTPDEKTRLDEYADHLIDEIMND
jgi:small GTP-binding protein